MPALNCPTPWPAWRTFTCAPRGLAHGCWLSRPNAWPARPAAMSTPTPGPVQHGLIATRQVEKGPTGGRGPSSATPGMARCRCRPTAGWSFSAQAPGGCRRRPSGGQGAMPGPFRHPGQATTQRKARSLTELQLALPARAPGPALPQAGQCPGRPSGAEQGKLLQRSYWASPWPAWLHRDGGPGPAMMRRLRDLLEQTNVQLRQLGERDPLTGLHNRRAFEALAGLGMKKRCGARSCWMDVDGFKQINDQHGHGAGDLVLKGCLRPLRARPCVTMTSWCAGGGELV